MRNARIELRQRAAQICAALWLCVACFAQAQSVPERFKSICQSCHGEGGVSTTALTPSLAGLPSFYTVTQLFLFREGRRSNPMMTAMAKGLSDSDLRAFSEYIGKLPPPPEVPMQGLVPERMAMGARLSQEHRCASCHGADFSGGKQVARLANQREDYLLQTLKGFQSGERLGYTTAMNETLIGITHEGLEDIAYYLANAPRAKP